jgi:hypothetical protein
MLEENGVVGPGEGAKPREILAAMAEGAIPAQAGPAVSEAAEEPGGEQAKGEGDGWQKI